jgi:hypothetical protein
MHWDMRKIVIFLIALTRVLNADTYQDTQIRSLENRVTALEQRKGASAAINPPARPQVRNGLNLFVFGELLYWKANETGLPLAAVNRGSSENLAHSKGVNLRGKWDLGFRVGIGYNIPHDGWDSSLAWLRYHSSGPTSRIHSEENHFVFPSFFPSTDPIAIQGVCSRAKGQWSLLLDQLDLDLGREFFVSKWLTLRPQIGVRTNWIDQKPKVKYNDFLLLGFPKNSVRVKYRDQWWGIGLVGGLGTQWGLWEDWSIFGNLAGAILYGDHRIRMRVKDRPPTTSQFFTSSLPKGVFARLKNNMRNVVPILDLELGLRWDWMFANDRLHLGAECGWENHLYFSQNQFPIFCDGLNMGKFFANQGNLALTGAKFAVRLDF